MNKQQQRFNKRFPYGRDSWKFARPRHQFSWGASSELSLTSMLPYDAVEIPVEIVEHIYKLGWEDATSTAMEALINDR